MVYSNDENKISFAYESGTYGSIFTSGQWLGAVQSHTPSDEEGVKEITYLGTDSRSTSLFTDGQRDYTGTIEYYPQDWKMLAFAIGSNADSGSPSPYSHTMIESKNSDGNPMTSGAVFPSFQIEDAKQYNPTGLNFIRTYQGCVVNSLTIGASQGDFVSCKLDYVAQNMVHSSGTVTAVTDPRSRPFMWSDSILSLPSGTSVSTLKDWEFSINNNTEAPHYCNGSRVIGIPNQGPRKYNLDITTDMTHEQANAYYDTYYLGGSLFNTSLIINDVSAGAGSRDLTISMSGCRIFKMDEPSKTEGVQEMKMTIKPRNCSAVVADTTFKYWAW